tara:strand:+ start:4473 stop:4772 length:300 start_codon:yes stop_codon:yes gene_type:complete
MAKFHRADSFLKNTGVYDIFLDVSKMPSVPRNVQDEKYIIEAKYDQRPDLFAHDRFGSSRVWWIVALRNIDTLIDPVRDFKAGTEIAVPSKNTVETLIG